MQCTAMLERYLILQHRLHHHPSFSKAQEGGLKILPLRSLRGVNKTESSVVFGLLVQREGSVYLEDPDEVVQLDVSECVMVLIKPKASTIGMMGPEGVFVLVEGVYQNNILKCFTMGLPPSEPRSIRNDAPLIQDMSGIVVIADIHLNNQSVFGKLETIFQGFANQPPDMFLLLGNFYDPRIQTFSKRSYQEGMGKLVLYRLTTDKYDSTYIGTLFMSIHIGAWTTRSSISFSTSHSI